MIPRRVLATLCVTQVTGWGVLYYALPVLQVSIAADTGWSNTLVAGAFTLGQLAAAVVGVLVGRTLDRHGPRVLMSVGSVVAVLALVLVATAATPGRFALAWLLAGTAMAAVLYGPAFAAITGWFEGEARMRALMVLTVAGGLASTVFAPLTTQLHSRLDWRDTYLVLALLLAVTAPLHWWGLRGPWPSRPAPSGPGDRLRSIVASRAFLALAAALTITGLCATAVVVNLVPLLRQQGMDLHTAGAVLAAGGLGQVVGRLGYWRIARRLRPVAQAAGVVAVLTVTTFLLGLFDALAALVAVVVVAGLARGALTLLRATAVTDRWGSASYARLTGVLSLPVAVASAFAPWVGAQLAVWLGSYAAAFVALGALNAVALVVCLATQPRPTPLPYRTNHSSISPVLTR